QSGRPGTVSAGAIVPLDAGRIGEVAVVGDETVDVLSPSVVENPVARLGQRPVWCGAVFVTGLGDDGQLAERPGSVGAVPEGLLPMVLATEAHEVPLGGG